MQIDKIPAHKTILIPVASEDIPESVEFVTDIKVLICNGLKYNVFDAWSWVKGTPTPTALIKLSTGLKIQAGLLWQSKKNSNKMYFFVCDKL